MIFGEVDDISKNMFYVVRGGTDSRAMANKRFYLEVCMTAEIKKFFSKQEECRQTPGVCMKSSLRRFSTAYLPGSAGGSSPAQCRDAMPCVSMRARRPRSQGFSETAFDLVVLFLLILAVCAVPANAQNTGKTYNADISISEILSAVQKNVDFLKENIVDLVGSEEITVEEFNNKGINSKGKIEKTTNVISEYRIFAGSVNNASGCDFVSEALYLPQSRRLINISREVSGIPREALGIPREERKTLSVKVNNKTPRTGRVMFNEPDWAEEHSFAGYLVLFNKQYEKCFDYKLLGVEKINNRAAYVVEITSKESGGEETTDMRLNAVYKSVALIDAETMDIVQLSRGRVNINHDALADLSNADPVAVLNRAVLSTDPEESRLHYEILMKILQSNIDKGVKDDPMYGYFLGPFTVLDTWEYFFTRYEYGKVNIGDRFLTLPVAKTIEVFEIISNKRETIDRLAAVYKYSYNDYKPASQEETQELLNSGNTPEDLQAKIIQSAQQQVELLKEHLINLVRKEEISVEYWEPDKNKIWKTSNVISEYRAIPLGAAGIMAALTRAILPPEWEKNPPVRPFYSPTALKLIFPDSDGTIETVPYCQALVFWDGRNYFMKENRAILSAKENGKAVKHIQNPSWLEMQNSLAELLIFFDKQNEKCFDYKLLGFTKVKERDAIVMEIKLKKSLDKKADMDNIARYDKDSNAFLAAYEYTDRMLFDAETLDVIKYEKTAFLKGRVVPYTSFPKPQCQAARDSRGNCIGQTPGSFRYGVYTNNTFKFAARRGDEFSKIYFHQVEYDKIKIKDQFLTLPALKNIEFFFFQPQDGTLFHSTLSNMRYSDFKADHMSVSGIVLSVLYIPYKKPTSPDLFSFPREVHTYKYSDYRLFDVDTKITFGDPEESPDTEE